MSPSDNEVMAVLHIRIHPTKYPMQLRLIRPWLFPEDEADKGVQWVCTEATHMTSQYD